MSSPHLAGLYSELVLASTSPARRALMDGLGVPYRVQAPGVDEEVPAALAPQQAVAVLAERKARAVSLQHPQALVIGSDQLVAFQGKALGKPPDATAAAAQLEALAGHTHAIHTALCVVGPGYFALEVDTAKLAIAPLTKGEVDAYVATGEWQGCAGGYRIEGKGQALFDSIDGDRAAIQGLPMARLVRLLREAGVHLFGAR